MSEKELGQLAYDSYIKDGTRSYWDRLHGAQKADWARVEAAVLEKAARIAENHSWGREIDWWMHATKKEVSKVAAEECAAAEITALRARVEAAEAQAVEAERQLAKVRKALHTIGYGPPRVGDTITLLNNFVSLARAAIANLPPPEPDPEPDPASNLIPFERP